MCLILGCVFRCVPYVCRVLASKINCVPSVSSFSLVFSFLEIVVNMAINLMFIGCVKYVKVVKADTHDTHWIKFN